ncbi:BRO family protein [Streptomyces europaeiscabiei]|uniref:BRO family protein n=1 Tax=Streptomyces europaeiscabiei TaxID=146819 RepID=UPI0029B28573|nr:BRO family protein [Streptomyces europaeiscabiei]MDX3588554.1 BRO family protein [Streptomyces europaeiscabiei]
MTTPLVFTFPETAQHVRSVMIDTDPWWVARDVCAVLDIRNVADAMSSLDEDEKGVATTDTPGGPQQTAIINEPGLYSLILRSRKPQAKAFKRWITHEVIPSIRRTGSYSVEPAAPALPQDYEEALVALLGQVRETKALTARVAELEPAAQSWQTLASADGDFSVADAAKILARDPAIKLGRNRLFTLLDEYRWTYRQLADDRPRVMQAAIERQWLSEIPQSHYHPRTGELVMDAPQVRVTVKGLHELHKRLGGTAAVAVPTVPAQQAVVR